MIVTCFTKIQQITRLIARLFRRLFLRSLDLLFIWFLFIHSLVGLITCLIVLLVKDRTSGGLIDGAMEQRLDRQLYISSNDDKWKQQHLDSWKLSFVPPNLYNAVIAQVSQWKFPTSQHQHIFTKEGKTSGVRHNVFHENLIEHELIMQWLKKAIQYWCSDKSVSYILAACGRPYRLSS